MSLTKNDLQAIEGIVAKRVAEGTEELARLVNKGFQEQHDFIAVGFQKVNNRLDALDVARADLRDLVTILASKNVLTVEEAARLGVPLRRPAGA